MNYICTMQIFESSQNLIQEKLAVLLTELLTAFDDGREIGLHQFRNDVTKLASTIHVLKVLSRFGQNNRIDANNLNQYRDVHFSA